MNVQAIQKTALHPFSVLTMQRTQLLDSYVSSYINRPFGQGQEPYSDALLGFRRTPRVRRRQQVCSHHGQGHAREAGSCNARLKRCRSLADQFPRFVTVLFSVSALGSKEESRRIIERSTRIFWSTPPSRKNCNPRV